MTATGRPRDSTVKRSPCATCRSREEKERLASEALIVATSQHGSSGFHYLSQGAAPFSQPYPWGIIMAHQ